LEYDRAYSVRQNRTIIITAFWQRNALIEAEERLIVRQIHTAPRLERNIIQNDEGDIRYEVAEFSGTGEKPMLRQGIRKLRNS